MSKEDKLPVEIHFVGVDKLPLYATIPICFRVTSILHVQPVDGGLGGLRLVEEPVVPPYVKDYDDQEDISGWPDQFDVSNWAFLLALRGERAVGGATVAANSPGVNMLEGRQDLAVLWDIRVHPQERGHRIGTQLFRRAVGWAREQGYRQLKVETQNVNVPACRFYARQGCRLGVIHRYAYVTSPGQAHEAMLLWYLDLNEG